MKLKPILESRCLRCTGPLKHAMDLKFISVCFMMDFV